MFREANELTKVEHTSDESMSTHRGIEIIKETHSTTETTVVNEKEFKSIIHKSEMSSYQLSGRKRIVENLPTTSSESCPSKSSSESVEIENIRIAHSSRCKDSMRKSAQGKASTETTKNIDRYGYVPPQYDKATLRKTGSFHEDYEKIKQIGKGSFAIVYLVRSRVTGQEFACRDIVKKATMQALGAGGGRTNIDPIAEELDILQRISHKNLIQLVDVYYEKVGLDPDRPGDHVLMIMELANQSDFIANILRKPYENQHIRSQFSQMISGVEYLHSQGIAHRDLKPENILVHRFSHGTGDPISQSSSSSRSDESINSAQSQPSTGLRGILKITDFGMSRIVGGIVSPEVLEGTITGANYDRDPNDFQRPSFLDDSLDDGSDESSGGINVEVAEDLKGQLKSMNDELKELYKKIKSNSFGPSVLPLNPAKTIVGTPQYLAPEVYLRWRARILNDSSTTRRLTLQRATRLLPRIRRYGLFGVVPSLESVYSDYESSHRKIVRRLPDGKEILKAENISEDLSDLSSPIPRTGIVTDGYAVEFTCPSSTDKAFKLLELREIQQIREDEGTLLSTDIEYYPLPNEKLIPLDDETVDIIARCTHLDVARIVLVTPSNRDVNTPLCSAVDLVSDRLPSSHLAMLEEAQARVFVLRLAQMVKTLARCRRDKPIFINSPTKLSKTHHSHINNHTSRDKERAPKMEVFTDLSQEEYLTMKSKFSPCIPIVSIPLAPTVPIHPSGRAPLMPDTKFSWPASWEDPHGGLRPCICEEAESSDNSENPSSCAPDGSVIPCKCRRIDFKNSPNAVDSPELSAKLQMLKQKTSGFPPLGPRGPLRARLGDLQRIDLAVSSGYDAKRADMWSLGVILFNMCTGRGMFSVKQGHNVVEDVIMETRQILCCACSFDVESMWYLNAGMRDLILSLCRVNPDHRIPSWAVMLHPWMRPMVWHPEIVNKLYQESLLRKRNGRNRFSEITSSRKDTNSNHSMVSGGESESSESDLPKDDIVSSDSSLENNSQPRKLTNDEITLFLSKFLINHDYVVGYDSMPPFVEKMFNEPKRLLQKKLEEKQSKLNGEK